MMNEIELSELSGFSIEELNVPNQDSRLGAVKAIFSQEGRELGSVPNKTRLVEKAFQARIEAAFRENVLPNLKTRKEKLAAKDALYWETGTKVWLSPQELGMRPRKRNRNK